MDLLPQHERYAQREGKKSRFIGRPSSRPEMTDVVKMAIDEVYASRGPEWSSQYQRADTSERLRLLRGDHGKSKTQGRKAATVNQWDALYDAAARPDQGAMEKEMEALMARRGMQI